MAKAWVLVANHTDARMFEAEHRASALKELEVLHYPEGRMKGRDLLADAPGRVFDRYGHASRSMGNMSDLRRDGGEKFAREIAHALERAHEEGKYENLYIVAEPQMVGPLRHALSPTTRAAIVGETGKNMIHNNPDEIRKQLPDFL
ncbi:host attachment protein [Microbulbifer guangxiensis]|uniref:host attachment protein n=1 Tax=Microbulbifer guangxiensis TaxID=2904249 RepID=UPI001F3361ED|nr:host attachment protein [Microbulbifer guangxiensis]